ncbi:PrpF protein [Gaiella occulta]|uniref:PrpF protein n=1 Tax=Gaiella occulta TaxID=1002870 RepID=A0A7M2YZ34_9ACTN|nr:PrpF domain-containing protein [Gaiella occulta]RDI75350.1 PrpF protein [Gaiella occulta]
MTERLGLARAGGRRRTDAAAPPEGLLREHWPAAVVHGDQLAVPAVVMRGGTSRGVFFHADDLPLDPLVRDRVILAVFGSPDTRQLDGIGGATPLTSKVAIVSRSSADDADVDYLFGQVGTDEPRIDYVGNCGNMLAAVGPFAVDEGLVRPRSPATSIRIRVVNSGQTVVAHVLTAGTKARTAGTTAIAGVPGTGASVAMELTGLGATLGRGLLPTGLRRETITSLGRRHPVSLVDAGNPTVFVEASQIGLDVEVLLADRLDGVVLERLEALRAAGAVRLGLVRRVERARADSPTIPKIYVVHPPAAYVDRGGGRVEAADVSLVVRGLSMGVPHPAVATTVAACVGAAARIPGTVVADALVAAASGPIRIGTPSGVVEIESVVDLTGEPRLVHARIERTARRLMAGLAHVPLSVLAENRRAAR